MLLEAVRKWLGEPPLADRILWRDSLRSETMISEDRGLIARAFGSLCATGGGVGLVLVATGQVSGRSDVLAILCLGALLLSALCFIAYSRLPVWTFQALTLIGTGMITIGANNAPSGIEGIYALFYVWVVILSSLFFSVRAAALQIAVAVLAFASVVVARDVPFALNYSLVTAVVLATSGTTIVMLRARLERLATGLASDALTDSLTSLANRRGFDQRFRLEADRAKRTGRPLSLIVCDLDRFKSLNDRLGHIEGDGALKRTAAAIAASVRSIDAVSRIGGEEFAVLLPDAGGDEALEVAERVRTGILDEFGDHPVQLTASCGVATRQRNGEIADVLFKEADEALYRAKRAGRNCSVAYEAGASSSAASSTK